MILLDRMSGLPVLPLERRSTPLGIATVTAIDTENQRVTIDLAGNGSDGTCDPEFIGAAFYSSVEAFPR